MTALTYGGETPTVGADEDTWGTENNTALTEIYADLQMLNTTTANTFLGRNEGTTGEVERLSVAEATAMLNAVVGASQSVAGTKGVVPQPTAGQQDRVLAGDGTFRLGLGRAAGGTITTTNVNGSQPTVAGALNIASVSTLTVAGAVSSCTVNFTNNLPSAVYQVHASGNGSTTAAGTVVDTKAVGSFKLYWDNTGGSRTEIDFSVFAS